MTQAEPRRYARRRPLQLAARCRTQSGIKDEGFLTDISANGCCVTTRNMFHRIGARITIRPDGLEGIAGVVRWIRGNQAGIEFESPLYGPVVDHLVARFSGVNPVDISRS